MKPLLITFGCSWTYGVGVGYTKGDSVTEYEKIAWNKKICNQFSWRGLLSKKYNLINANFAAGGSSNQKQFRLAKEFFSLKKIEHLKNNFGKILVVWGITSTARNEMWLLESGKLVNFFYSDQNKSKLIEYLLKFHYDHDYEVQSLKTEIHHWNTFFKSLNIDNLWFDTFNHHNYDLPGLKLIQPIDNLLFNHENPRDLLSKLALNNGCQSMDDRYHTSNWNIDSNRVKYLSNCEILNPISYHPTQLGHAQIADMLSPYIETFL